MDEHYSRILDENMALIESPLIAPSNSYYRQHYKTALYPYNISAHSTFQTDVDSSYDKELNGNFGDETGNYNSYEKQSRYQKSQSENESKNKCVSNSSLKYIDKVLNALLVK